MQKRTWEGGVARGVLHARCVDCIILQHTMGPAPPPLQEFAIFVVSSYPQIAMQW
jgi:hypothetical protein